MARPIATSLAQAAADKLGGRRAIGRAVVSDHDLARAVASGFSVAVIDGLKASGLNDKEIDSLVIKRRTLSHRKANGQRLTPEESDRAARVARVLALAEQTFHDRDKADRWIHKELILLDGRRPIDLIATGTGARLVEEILAKIAWGAAA